MAVKNYPSRLIGFSRWCESTGTAPWSLNTGSDDGCHSAIKENNEHLDEDAVRQKEEDGFRTHMYNLANFVACSGKSVVMSPDKFDSIVQYLKNPEECLLSPHVRFWVKSRGFQLMDFPEKNLKQMLVKPVSTDMGDSEQKGVSGSQYATVLHSDALFDVVRHVHEVIFLHGGYKRVLNYIQQHYYGVTRGYVQQFCSLCPVCRYRKRRPANSLRYHPRHHRLHKLRAAAAAVPFDSETGQEVIAGDDAYDLEEAAGSGCGGGDGGGAMMVVAPDAGDSTDTETEGETSGTQRRPGHSHPKHQQLSSSSSSSTTRTQTIVCGDQVYIVTLNNDNVDETLSDNGHVDSRPEDSAGTEPVTPPHPQDTAPTSLHDDSGTQSKPPEESGFLLYPSFIKQEVVDETDSSSQMLSQPLPGGDDHGVQSVAAGSSRYRHSSGGSQTGSGPQMDGSPVGARISGKRSRDSDCGVNYAERTWGSCCDSAKADRSRSSAQGVRARRCGGEAECGASSSVPCDREKHGSPAAKKPKHFLQRHLSGQDGSSSTPFFNDLLIDLIDMTDTPHEGYRYIGHVTDHMTQLHVLFPLREATAPAVAEALDQRVFAYYGLPNTLHCNLGHGFVNDLIECLSLTVEGGVPCANGEPPGPSGGREERVRKRVGASVVKEVVAMLTVERCGHALTGEVPWLSWLPRMMRSLNRDWHAALRGKAV